MKCLNAEVARFAALNADLRAQRDELLAACEAMLRSIEALVSAEDDDGDVAATFPAPMLVVARAAIAKARGK